MDFKLHKYKFKTDKATSQRMSHVPSKRGKDENILALALWHSGIRYRRNYKKLPGKPDIAITKYKIAIFVDGEFWHGYDWKHYKKHLKRNREYWIHKIEYNMRRDQENDQKLKEMGWTPMHFWAKLVLKHTNYCVELIKFKINSKLNDQNKT
ncbi:MAG: very short patch repair endonuclease [Lactobacillus sp.]|nr:very short patch repair endonuclease [Lactobacillus sp.]